MMAMIGDYWQARSGRERVMLSVMLVLAAGVGIWLGLYRPVEAGLRAAREAQVEALVREERVRVAAAALRRDAGAAAAPLSVPLDQWISQSAGEAGFTLAQITPQGDARVQIAIAAVRSGALLSWIAAMERHGVMVQTITLSPSGGTGTLSAQMVLQRRRAS